MQTTSDASMSPDTEMDPPTAFSVDGGRGRLWTEDPGRLAPIPLDKRAAFAPATYYLYEWTDCWLEYSGADHVQVGGTRVVPLKGTHLFPLRFENHLGLTAIQPHAGQKPLGSPCYLEVISPKFPTLSLHLDFFSALLDDLFVRAARLPFSFSAPTSRAVGEAMSTPTPLFVFHFLRHFGPTLRQALTVIQAEPHRELRDNPELSSLASASEADADVLLSILHEPRLLARTTSSIPLVRKLHGYAPEQVWQRRPYETFDTPENRFVLAFARQLQGAAEYLTRQSWWEDVSSDRQHAIHEVSILLRHVIGTPLFREVSALRHFPSASQVLLRREGYRALFQLWQVFHHARRPLFGRLQHAIDVRDIAQLYEMWVFFALVEELTQLLQQTPVVEMSASDEHGLKWRAKAHFGVSGTLVYNTSGRSYSVPLRPDFMWLSGRAGDVVLDAKFRLDRWQMEDGSDDSPQMSAKRADLYKMHTYRDALGVRAAVCIYPGNASLFYDQTRTRDARTPLTLGELLCRDLSGIGAIAMSPLDLKEIPV